MSDFRLRFCLALLVLVGLPGCETKKVFAPGEHVADSCSMADSLKLREENKVVKSSFLDLVSDGGVALSVDQATKQQDFRGASQAAYLDMVHQDGLLHSPSALKLVNEIATPLKGYWRQAVEPQIVVLPVFSPGAFSGGDGTIYVNLGTLLLADSQDEVAGILAHEMGHIACGHVFEKRSKLSILADIPITLTTAAAQLPVATTMNLVEGKPLGRSYDISLASLRNRGWNREKERTADLIAVDTLVASGYNENAMLVGLDRLDDSIDTSIRPEDLGPFSGTSHPSKDERIQSVQSYVDTTYADHRPGQLKKASLVKWKHDYAQYAASLKHLIAAKEILVNPFVLMGMNVQSFVVLNPSLGTKIAQSDVAENELRTAFHIKGAMDPQLAKIAAGEALGPDQETNALAKLFVSRWMAAELRARRSGGKTIERDLGKLINSPDTPIGLYVFAATARAYLGDKTHAEGLINMALQKYPASHLGLCAIHTYTQNYWLGSKGGPLSECIGEKIPHASIITKSAFERRGLFSGGAPNMAAIESAADQDRKYTGEQQVRFLMTTFTVNSL